MQQLAEVVPFLANKNAQVREEAMRQIVGFIHVPEASAILKKAELVSYLCRIIGDPSPSVAQYAVSVLINTCDDPEYFADMLKHNIVGRLLDNILESTSVERKLMTLYVQLLSNVTRDPEASKKLLNLDDPSLKGYYLHKIVSLFFQDDPEVDRFSIPAPEDDQFAWIANILTNVTQLEEGREILMDKSKGIFKKMVNQLNHPNVIRRRGVFGTVRNCLFDKKPHDWVLEDDIGLLEAVAWPIRGGEVFDADDAKGMPDKLRNAPSTKKRDEDIEVRRMAVDCLLLMTATDRGTILLKKRKIYPLMREYDKAEDDEEATFAIYKLVNVLMGDDSPAVPPEELAEEEAKFAPKPANLPQIEASPIIEEPAKKKVDVDEYGEEIEEI